MEQKDEEKSFVDIYDYPELGAVALARFYLRGLTVVLALFGLGVLVHGLVTRAGFAVPVALAVVALPLFLLFGYARSRIGARGRSADTPDRGNR